ncbi:MAG: SPOR domain-containing protein, partial [Candidatus Zixiibacteriota bacterium]
VPLVYPQKGAIYGKEAPLSAESLFYAKESSVAIESPSTFNTLNNQVYRIQIFTSQLYGEARRAMTIAEEIFDRTVFLDYEVPYYKVRVGGFAQRYEAEDYLSRVKAAGYPDAWVVVVNVAIKEPAPLYPDGSPAAAEDSIEYPENDKSDD